MTDWISSFPLTRHVMEGGTRQVCRVVSTGPVPQHVGFIMDGNRRYAKKNHIEMKEGHSSGFDSMAHVLEVCYNCGVQVVTVFAFSIENFNRSKYEVEWLMRLAKAKFKQVVAHGELCERYGVKIRVIGNRTLVPKDLRAVLEDAERITCKNKRAVLNVCFAYTARDDLTHAVRAVVKHYTPQDITEDLLTQNMYTGAGFPKLELLIRTSSVHRLSDFMLWECIDPACDIEIVDFLWPEFTPQRMLWLLLKWGLRRTYYGIRMAKLINFEDDQLAHTKQA